MTDPGTFDSAEKLQSLRRSIDNIDAALVHLLAERFKFTQDVGWLCRGHDDLTETLDLGKGRSL